VTGERCLHLDLDGAWPAQSLPLPRIDALQWGPRLRFCAPDREMRAFRANVLDPLGAARFLTYGSGDFHHLSALMVGRITQPLTLISFDNHPDWDIRPPKWCCGSWINRALALPQVERAEVWGCGNFECWGWHRLWGNHRDVRSKRLKVHPWADERPISSQSKPGAITRANWRERFSQFASGLAGRALYVTVDIDGLQASSAATNWENGRFTPEDICWALEELSQYGAIVAGDFCGAHSQPAYARRFQRFASETDHPKLPAPDPAAAARVNASAWQTIWPHLTRA
jgi:hypothetical protein